MGEKKRILFVDADTHILNGLKRTMHVQCSEWDVVLAGGGEEALRLMRDQTFDVIVTEMQMPEMNGRQLLEAVHHQYPKTVRIILTGEIDLNESNPMIEDYFLHKPCNSSKLKATLDLARSA